MQGPPTPRMSSVMAAPENLPFELRVLEVALDTVRRFEVYVGSFNAMPTQLRHHPVPAHVCLKLRAECFLSTAACWCMQVARYIENLSGDLEQAAHPALDALTLTVRMPGMR